MSLIRLLQDWYKTNCNIDNYMGITIETTDCCSWHVVIDLFNTDYETKNFTPIYIHTNDNNWTRCVKENALFQGYGGMQNLEDILDIFYKWVTNN